MGSERRHPAAAAAAAPPPLVLLLLLLAALCGVCQPAPAPHSDTAAVSSSSPGAARPAPLQRVRRSASSHYCGSHLASMLEVVCGVTGGGIGKRGSPSPGQYCTAQAAPAADLLTGHMDGWTK